MCAYTHTHAYTNIHTGFFSKDLSFKSWRRMYACMCVYMCMDLCSKHTHKPIFSRGTCHSNHDDACMYLCMYICACMCGANIYTYRFFLEGPVIQIMTTISATVFGVPVIALIYVCMYVCMYVYIYIYKSKMKTVEKLKSMRTYIHACT